MSKNEKYFSDKTCAACGLSTGALKSEGAGKPCVMRVPVFQKLAAEQLRQIAACVEKKVYEDKELILAEGKAFNALLIVRYGSVRLARNKTDGEEVVVDILSQGDFYGGEKLFSEEISSERLVAMGPTGICFLSAERLAALILKNPEISLKLLHYYSELSGQYRRLHEILSVRDARKRLGLFLLDQSRRQGHPVLALSQEDIGRSINLAHETVNRKLQELREGGWIRGGGYKRIEIIDPSGLSAACDG